MKTLPYYLAGVMLACLVHVSTGCPKHVTPNVKWPDVDMAQIKAGAQSAEDAFAAGDTELLKTAMSPEAQKRYEALLPQLQASDMAAFAQAIKQRKLSFYSDIYAVYTYSADGETYDIAFALQDDDTWKLMQF